MPKKRRPEVEALARSLNPVAWESEEASPLARRYARAWAEATLKGLNEYGFAVCRTRESQP